MEPSPRVICCGALGRLSPQEALFNAPIRTPVPKRLGGNSNRSVQDPSTPRWLRCHLQNSGLLAGVTRAELIPRLETEVRPLHSEDLLAAEEFLGSSSVRGVLRAELTSLPHANMQKS